MTTTVRISPLAIFCFVCGSFIVLYSLKHWMSTNNLLSDNLLSDNLLSDNLLSERYISEEIRIPLRRLLETSIYLAEKGGKVLKDIRGKSDLQVCIIN